MKATTPKPPYWTLQMRTFAASVSYRRGRWWPYARLWADGSSGPLAPKTATRAPSRRLSALLHDLPLKTNANVDISARAIARVHLDSQFYL